MKDRKKIDEVFNEAFTGFEAEPPADTWSNIEQNLESAKRRKRIAYWRWAGTAAAVVLAFFTGYLVNPGEMNEREMDAPQNGISEKNQNRQAEDLVSEYPEDEVSIFSREEEPESKNPVKKDARRDMGNATQTGGEELAARDYSGEKSKQRIQALRETVDLNLPEKEALASSYELINENTPANHEDISKSISIFTESEIVITPADDPSEELSQTMLPADHSALRTNDEMKSDNYFKTSGLSLSLMASPTFAFRDVNIQETNDAFLAENVSNENLMNSYTAGVDVSYRQSSRLEFQAGIYLNNWAQSNDRVILNSGTGSSFTSSNPPEVYGNTSVSNVRLVNSSVSTDLASFPTPDSSLAYALVPGISQQYQFIEIPLSVGFYLLESKKWGVKIRGGLSTRFLSGSDVSLAYPDGSERALRNDGLNPFSLQLLAGTGVEYRINRHLRVQLLPSLQYGLTSVNRNKEVDTYFHQALIYSGLSYKF